MVVVRLMVLTLSDEHNVDGSADIPSPADDDDIADADIIFGVPAVAIALDLDVVIVGTLLVLVGQPVFAVASVASADISRLSNCSANNDWPPSTQVSLRGDDGVGVDADAH